MWGVSPALWPEGEYFTDGSGGDHGSVPSLRRCGCGIARLSSTSAFVFGAFFALLGSAQAVPRSELVAMIVLCFLLAPQSAATVHCDNLGTVNGMLKHKKHGLNTDLWRTLWETIGRKYLTTTPIWVKAHAIDKPEVANNVRSHSSSNDRQSFC